MSAEVPVFVRVINVFVFVRMRARESDFRFAKVSAPPIRKCRAGYEAIRGKESRERIGDRIARPATTQPRDERVDGL